MNMHEKPVEGKIAALRAGREGASTWVEVWRGVGASALLDARDNAATVGDEFSALRELRRRERARRAGR